MASLALTLSKKSCQGFQSVTASLFNTSSIHRGSMYTIFWFFSFPASIWTFHEGVSWEFESKHLSTSKNKQIRPKLFRYLIALVSEAHPTPISQPFELTWFIFFVDTKRLFCRNFIVLKVLVVFANFWLSCWGVSSSIHVTSKQEASCRHSLQHQSNTIVVWNSHNRKWKLPHCSIY